MKFKNLKTNFLGRESFYYREIDSTQKEIWRRIHDKEAFSEFDEIKDGTLIYADFQTSAIGTHGRKWYTDEDNNIAFSIFLNMNCDVKNLEGLTLKIAEVIVQIFKDIYNIKLKIKEPNDIYFADKKIGGILTESKVFSDKARYLVIGIGINTNKENFNENIKNIATSIKKEFGVIVDKEDFISEFCNSFEETILLIRNK